MSEIVYSVTRILLNQIAPSLAVKEVTVAVHRAPTLAVHPPEYGAAPRPHSAFVSTSK